MTIRSFGKPFVVTAILIVASVVSFLTFSFEQPSTKAGTFADGERPWGVTPAGKLIVDADTGEPAVAPMTMNFVRTPDSGGPDGRGRFLIAVNSGYGLLFDSESKAQQTLSVIDLNGSPEPKVIQNVYFPAPQSANVGLVFDPLRQHDGRWRFYVSGGVENKVWIFSFDPRQRRPILPANDRDKKVDAPFIDVNGFSKYAPSPSYNDERAPVYPTGLGISPNGQTIYIANNLGDTLGIVDDIRGERRLSTFDLRRAGSSQFVYPYDVKVISRGKAVEKVYVSLWGDSAIACLRIGNPSSIKHIDVESHPTAMLLSKDQSRLFVVNSDADSVSVVDTASDKVIETIQLRLSENERAGSSSPEGLALSDDETTLFVASARANAVAVVKLERSPAGSKGSRLLGFIPTGSYATAVAVVGNRLFAANGKGTGMDNSSLRVNETGLYPNMPNKEFPPTRNSKRGMYSVVIVSGNISVIKIPSERELFDHTQRVMRNNGLIGREKRNIFPGGRSPFKHVIYIIRENRTYDQVLGDLPAAGNGQKADGDPSVAIFGAGDAAISPGGKAQNITPNARALALRFGLLDRFFVNAEASPDGHNWSTAAFSTDYVDKAFRWDYSGRGRTYDYEGFNRLPSYNPSWNQPQVAIAPVFDLPASEKDIEKFLKRYVPYLNGGRDIAEPASLYLWDAAKRTGLTYRNYGEFVATVSANDVKEVNDRKSKSYPDVSPTLTAFAVKKSLEDHFSPTFRNFDQNTPDILSTDSYKTAVESNGSIDGAITSENRDTRFRGTSRFGEWIREFRGYVEARQNGKADHMPNLSIVRFSNDHTAGLHTNVPTPQFYVAENDYAVGRLVEEVSKSPYWSDTAIFVVEDDAQDGPDHVDAHRSPALIISAYNRQGALVHEFHNTVSLIRTIELCLGIEPMNFLDAHASPIDIFTDKADMRPFISKLPTVAVDNLFPPVKPTKAMLDFMRLTDRQNLSRADMANPGELNRIIWFSVRGESPMPAVARLPAFGLMTAGMNLTETNDEDEADE